MKKILLCIAVLISPILFAQQNEEPVLGIPVTIGVDSDVWRSGTGILRSDNVTRIIPQGTKVLVYSAGFQIRINGVFEDSTFIVYANNQYIIRTSNLSPLGEARLPRSWITTQDSQRKWVLSFYLNVLRSQDRETFFNYERSWMDWATQLSMQGDPTGGSWHDALINFESLVFFDAVITIGGFSRRNLFITDIVPFNSGYRMTMSSIRLMLGDDHERFAGFHMEPSSLPFPNLPGGQQSLDLIFIPDGDFMDVYLDSVDNHFATFAKVETIFLEELQRLVRTNTVDLSNITSWPRRADGSMDISPPDGVTLAFRATHTTTARLNVRDNPTTAAPLITTLELGTKVQILETGHTETIGEITAPWVRVLSTDSFSGWCFSGFLEAIVVESAVVEAQPPFQAPAVVVPQADDVAESGIPLWVWLAIVGATVVVGGIVFAVKRKWT